MTVKLSTVLFCPNKRSSYFTLLLPCLCVILVCIFAVVYLLSNWFNDTDSASLKVTIILLIFFCLFCASIVVIFMIAVIKEFCVKKKINNWVIHNYEEESVGRLINGDDVEEFPNSLYEENNSSNIRST